MYQQNESGRPSISKNSDTSNQNYLNNDLNRQSNELNKLSGFERPSNEFANNFNNMFINEKFSFELQRESNTSGRNSFFKQNSPNFPFSNRPSQQQQQQQIQLNQPQQLRFSLNDSNPFGQEENRDSFEQILFQQNFQNINENEFNQGFVQNRPSIIPRFSHQNQSNIIEQDQQVIQEINNSRTERDSQGNGISFQSFHFNSNPPPPIHDTSSSLNDNKIKKQIDDSDDNEEEKKMQEQGCNCKKSKCLKLYCECFQRQRDCGPYCKCVDCKNLPQFCQDQIAAKQQVLMKNPDAFTSKIGVLGEIIEDNDMILKENLENNNNYNTSSSNNNNNNIIILNNNNNISFNCNVNNNNNYFNQSNSNSNENNSDKNYTISNNEINQVASFVYKKGCNCKKTNCLKKYCECYNAGVKCSHHCKCEGCSNVVNQQVNQPLQQQKQQLQFQQQQQQYPFPQQQQQFKQMNQNLLQQQYQQNVLFYNNNNNQFQGNKQNLSYFEQNYTQRKRAKTAMDIEEEINMERKRQSIKMAQLGIEEK